MDFFKIKEVSVKQGIIEVFPDFRVCRSKDLMIRGGSFYAIWDEQNLIWSTDEYDVQTLVDAELDSHVDKLKKRTSDNVVVKRMSDFSTGSWRQYKNYVKNLADNSTQLNSKLIFADDITCKEDYASIRLPYNMSEGSIEAYSELMDTIYDPEERLKLEWAIGSIFAGDSVDIQKFIVLYGEPGKGKGTFIAILEKLFAGYHSVFNAKEITSKGNAFGTAAFKSNPLVGIQNDGDLSKIEDNTTLNSIVSHEIIQINEKHEKAYPAKIQSFLFLASNKPVQITDSKSGLIRRLIDVSPSGRKVPPRKYHSLTTKVNFELGHIASHCLNVYLDRGKYFYEGYKPLTMQYQTDVFFNYVENYALEFMQMDGVTLKQAYDMYKQYASETNLQYTMPQYKFREELKSYFNLFEDRARVDGKSVRSYYSGFKKEKFTEFVKPPEDPQPTKMSFEETVSILDSECKDQPAQLASVYETPSSKWDSVKTTLSDIDTSKLHYVKLDLNHIVIDFDIKDDTGEKSLELNMEAASKFPSTYSELSKSGQGIHLHYYYEGDPEQLSRIFAEDIEVKVFVGNASLRRKLTRCNNIPIKTISSGLPIKEEKVVNFDTLKNERAIRTIVERSINKEIHAGTKPSVDFIHKVLEDAYSSGMAYDIRDLRPSVLAFAAQSSNQREYCLALYKQMKFQSEVEIFEKTIVPDVYPEELVFYDVEVFPNLFVSVWKTTTGDFVKMINPEPHEMEGLIRMQPIGFNNRRYDNHIIYGRYLGKTNAELYELSQRLIANSPNATYLEAYNLSYVDIYEFAATKQSLKKWEIELGLPHNELGLRWDEPVPEDKWDLVADYCCDDVYATQKVFEHLSEDFMARKILAELSGLPVNSTTQKHAARIIFQGDKKHHDQFIYTDLSKEFPGYEYDFGKSTYRGETTGEGGYVYAEPGMYEDVAVLDIVSMHPTTLIVLQAFGEEYTKRFAEIVQARVYVKQGKFEEAKTLLGGVLKPYLNPEYQDGLAYALKIVINIIYGMSSAKFDNDFKDPRNIDNIVAKRGALFMVDLKHAVQEKGFTVMHIKTDSIKIPGATPEIIKFAQDFAKSYGYTFEHESTYSKVCLINDAVLIAKIGWAEKEKLIDTWEAIGAQFKHPYVYKTLFSKEAIEFDDYSETKEVRSALYLDFNENLGEDLKLDKEINRRLSLPYPEEGLNDNKVYKGHKDYAAQTLSELKTISEPMHNRVFVGKVGAFVPVTPGSGGALLLRQDGKLLDKYHSANGAKGYRWMETEVVRELNKTEIIDERYFRALVDDAVETINEFGDFERFIN